MCTSIIGRHEISILFNWLSLVMTHDIDEVFSSKEYFQRLYIDSVSGFVDLRSLTDGRIPHHIRPIITCKPGALSIDNIQSLSGGHVDRIAREPTHSSLADIVWCFYIEGVNSYAHLCRHAPLVNRLINTQFKLFCITYGKGLIIGGLYNR